jgi:ribosomal protein S18 acetylase RimI-like enzyme
MIEDNLIDRSLFFARHFSGEIHGPNPIWFITGKALPTDNGIAKAMFNCAEMDECIEMALEPFKKRKLPLRWWVGPSSSPHNLGYYLQKYGLTHNRDMLGMAMELSRLPNPVTGPDLTLERVYNKKMLAQWYQLLLEGFPISYNQTYLDTLSVTSLDANSADRHFVARFKGEVVGISTLFLGGGVAGLYNVATHPQSREQGIGTWITIKTFEEAPPDYQIATLQTTYPNALRLYHRLGFEVYCKIGIYQLNTH